MLVGRYKFVDHSRVRYQTKGVESCRLFHGRVELVQAVGRRMVQAPCFSSYFSSYFALNLFTELRQESLGG